MPGYRWAEKLCPLLASWAPASLAQRLPSIAWDGASANFANYSCEGCCVLIMWLMRCKAGDPFGLVGPWRGGEAWSLSG